MKGNNRFTELEVEELRELINERIIADRSRQKSIRAKMRRLGFYGSHDFGIVDLQPADFEKLIQSGRIEVVNGRVSPRQAEVKKSVKETKVTERSEHRFDNFVMFDPIKHTSGHIPDEPGNYIVCIRKNSDLPGIGVKCDMVEYQNYRVIYTGIAGKSLRKRDYRQHFNGNNAGRSTLRKSLGSLFGYLKIARDQDPSSGKTKFKEADELALSKWMQSNLLLFFRANQSPNRLENDLIHKLNPPLNLSKNSNRVNQGFRRKLSELRTKR